MAVPKQFRAADYGYEIDELRNGQRKPLFRQVAIAWATPVQWAKGEDAPTGVGQTGCLYLILRDHHRALARERIVYVGIASDLGPRFQNHPKADRIAQTRGDVSLSVGIPLFTGRPSPQQIRAYLEELEHLLIWALWNKWMENEKKALTIPGLGRNRGHAWHIRNKGHRFAGQMPKELLYPWMLVISGRDRTRKLASGN